jgi:hypothetical protein
VVVVTLALVMAAVPRRNRLLACGSAAGWNRTRCAEVMTRTAACGDSKQYHHVNFPSGISEMTFEVSDDSASTSSLGKDLPLLQNWD